MRITFKVKKELEGGYSASCQKSGIFTQGDNVKELLNNCAEALSLNFDCQFTLANAGNMLNKLKNQVPGGRLEMLEFHASDPSNGKS